MAHDSRISALQSAVELIPDDYFAAYGGGWPGQISTALIDAVFSIRARYRTSNPETGVIGRVRSFQSAEPAAVDDLTALRDLGSARICEIMGSTVTGGRPKAEVVVEAAGTFMAAGVVHSDDFLAADQETMKDVYTGVVGLGPVTFEYFSMLLGVPGVKADTMIGRYVNNALRSAGHEAVTGKVARTLVIEVFDALQKGESLTHFDHAIWRFQSDQTSGSL